MNIPIELKTTILLLSASFNFLLSILIHLTAKNRSGRIFVALSLAAGLWALGIGLYIKPGITNYTYLFSYSNYIMGIAIAVTFFFFSYYLNSENKKMSKALFLSVIILSVFISLLISLGYVVEDIVEPNEDVKKEIFGPFYWLYSIFVLGLFAIALPILYIKYRNSEGENKKSISLILIGTAYSIMIGLTVNLILPGFFNMPEFVWLGPINTIIYVLFLTYAISRHGLWDFKMVATQIFISIIILTLFAEILFSGSIENSLLEIVVLLLIIFSSYFYIKSLLARVTERERMEKLASEINRVNKNLEELDVQKSDFVSIASHQLRTPLTVIKGYSSMLIEGVFGHMEDKKQLEIIKKIYRASKSLVTMIEGYLDVSKIEKKEMVYNFKKIDLYSEIKELIKELTQSAKDAGILLTYKTDGNKSYPITADKEKILQVVQNVVDNAIKYTPKGGNIDITLERNDTEGRILLTVSDNGIGISEYMKYRLFEKFSRGRGVSKLHTEGRGLGLYVTRQIMEAHRGSIRAESEGINKGTKFYVEFTDADYDDRRHEIKGFIHEL